MSTINHYLLDVTVSDSVFNSSKTITSDMKVAVLAVDEDDATSLAIDFFTRSGLAVKEVDGVQTLFRTEAVTGPGSIRTVKVLSVTPIAPAPAVTSTPTPAATASHSFAHGEGV